jgi:lipopolysaccharide export system permease protein
VRLILPKSVIPLKILPRYVLREILTPVVLSTLFFIVVLLVARVYDDLDLLLKAGVSGWALLQVIGIFLGTLLTLTVPMAVLLGTLIGVGRLTSDNEVMAMRTAGLHLWGVFKPVIFSGVALCCFLIAVNQFVIPAFYRQLDRIFYQIQFEIITNLEPGIVYDQLAPAGSDMTISFEKKIGTGSAQEALRMEGVSMRFVMNKKEVLADDAGGESAYIAFAQEGRVIGDPENREIQLILENGQWISEEVPTSDRTTVISFDKMETFLAANDDGLAQVERVKPQELGFFALLENLRTPPTVPVVRNSDGERRVPRVWRNYFAARNEMIQRFTLPLSCLAFILVAIPLAMEIRPRAKSLSVVMTALLVSLYYAFFAFAQSMGGSGAPLIVTVFLFLLPNLLMGGIGAWWFMKTTSQ